MADAAGTAGAAGAAPGKVHANGRSPVWVHMCERRLKGSEKRLPHPSKGQR